MRVKGTGVAHTGDVVPLEGIKGPGSANTYFDGYAYEKHVGVPVTPKAEIWVRLAFVCFPPAFTLQCLGILSIIPTLIGVGCAVLLGCLAAGFLLIGMKVSLREQECSNVDNDNDNDVREE